MRSAVAILLVSALLVPRRCLPQESPSQRIGDRLILSAGVGQVYSVAAANWLDGFHFRAEYDVMPPERILGLRVHVGGFWAPSQSSSVPTMFYSSGTTFESRAYALSLDLGLSGVVTPWPRARFSPYGVAGVARLQRWSSGSGYYRQADGSVAEFMPRATSGGEYGLLTGVGVQFRIGERMLQVESRRLSGRQTMLGVGTRIRF